MSLGRTWKVLRKDFALGPRSPFFLYAIFLPIIMTVIFQFAFGSLFDPQPRLGIVDEGDSEITAAVAEMEGIDLTIFEDAEELKTQVEQNDLDAGLILVADFDQRVKDAEQPKLEFYLGGESYASNRIILSVTAIDLVREIEGAAAPVEVEVVNFGTEGLPIAVRLIPIIVFYALVMAGIFVPGSSLVQEKEEGTMMAMLVTPIKANEVLAAKWLMGVIFATIMAIVALLLNQAVGSNWLDVFVVVLVAAMMSATLGLLIGSFSKDSTIMFGIVKGLGIFLFAPVIFYIFPEWPQWIAMIFPLYWIIEPIWQVSILGESLSAVWLELVVALAITGALMVLTVVVARRMQNQMAAD
jgi:ABC-2 type transport system permease protein